MADLMENWKSRVAELLDMSQDEVEAAIQNLDFSTYLLLGQEASEEEPNPQELRSLLGVGAPEPDEFDVEPEGEVGEEDEDHFDEWLRQHEEGDEDLEEQDNPFAGGSDLPTTPTLGDEPDVAVDDEQESRKDLDSLDFGDEVTVRSPLTGDTVDTTIRRRGPGETFVVPDSDGNDFVVQFDDILKTPVTESQKLDESISDGLRTIRLMIRHYRQDPPAIVLKAFNEVYQGQALPPRLSMSLEPYLRMLEALLRDNTYRMRLIQLIKQALGNESDFDDTGMGTGPELEIDPEDVDIDDVHDGRVRETTTAGAIASAPMGSKPEPKPKKKEYAQRKKKK